MIIVKVLQSPISERYCKSGDTATLDITNKQIRCSGAWFNIDDRWIIEYDSTTSIKIKDDAMHWWFGLSKSFRVSYCDEYSRRKNLSAGKTWEDLTKDEIIDIYLFNDLFKKF